MEAIRYAFSRSFDSRPALPITRLHKPAGTSLNQLSVRIEYWLWPYKHWRYRPSAAIRPYPFYAKHSVQFDLEIESQENPERAELLGEQIREYAKWRRNNE